MSEYVYTSSGTIEADVILAQVTAIKDLLNLEFASDEDNILLLRKITEKLYQEIMSIKRRLAKLDGIQ